MLKHAAWEIKRNSHIYLLNGAITAVGDWTSRSVLDALQPHLALECLKINSYEGIGFPTLVTSLNFLQHLTELCLDGCTMCEEFPQFGQYKSLEVLILKRLSKLQSLCSHSSSAAFPALK